MNYLIKSVLKKIFTQYLYIQDEGLDLTSGIIKLPLGNINQTRINKKLQPLGLRITASSYKNLIIHLPLVELMSKPIRVSIEVLDINIERVYRGEEASPRKESWSSAESSKETPGEEQVSELLGQESEGGYFRNIINRLLYNMQVCMDRINIRLNDIGEEQNFREAYFTLHSFNLKNSLVILEANIVKKTFTLEQLHLRHALGEVVVKDFSLCLDFSNKKLQVIAVGNSIKLNIFNLPYKMILKSLSKKKPTPRIAQPKKSQLQETSIFLKLNSISLNFKLIEVAVNTLELKCKSNERENEAIVNFGEIKCVNAVSEKEESYLMKIGYLPFSKLVKINSQFEDSAIKQCLLSFKQQTSGLPSITAKVYHLAVHVDINGCKEFIDRLIEKERDIEKIRTIVNKLKEQKQEEKPSEPEEMNNTVELLVYRAEVIAVYGPLRVQFFGSTLLQVKEEKLDNGLLLKKSSSSDKNESSSRGMERQSNKVTLIKVYQLGIRAFGYNLLEICDLQAKQSKKQLIINGNSVVSQISLSCIDKIVNQVAIIQRDVAYYQEKLKKVAFVSAQEPIPQRSGREKKEDKPLPFLQRIFLKVDELIVNIGQLIKVTEEQDVNQPKELNSSKCVEEDKFISVIDIQLSKFLSSLVSNKVKLNSQIIAYITSPYTLQRTPLTNQLQVELSLGIASNQLSISFKNKLVLLIHDHYINILYKLLDKEDVWCFVQNHTHERIVILQETRERVSFFQENSEQYEKRGLHQEQLYFYKANVEPLAKKHIFWLTDGSFKLLLGNRMSQQLQAKMASLENYSTKNGRYSYQVVKQIILSQDKDYDYILKLMYNKLGNLCEIAIDYKILITSYCKDYTFKIGSNSFAVKKSKREKWEWFVHLQDLTEDFSHYQLISDESTPMKIEQLMAHEQFNIMGIYETNRTSEVAKKLYDSYIYQSKSGGQLKYIIMPLLIIINNCLEDFQLEIIDKKSQETEKVLLKSRQTVELGHNGKFDYYLKQFTIKISVLTKQVVTFQSESLYFNTFFMVDHKTQTNVQLRSTQKNNYSKKSLIFEESLLLKTKVISLRSSLQINNSTDFNFTLQAKESNKSHIEKLDIDTHSVSEWTYRIKEDTIIEFLINRHIESKIEVRYGELKNMKLLSFNFCKIDDRFFNVFIRVQRRNLEGIETIMMDHFIEIINLCNYAGRVKVQTFPELRNGTRTNLPLNSTSLNKYNNKVIDLDDIAKIYAQIFLTAKVTDMPLSFLIGNHSIKFQSFLKESSQQLLIQRNQFIITLLKDMNNNKITFYLTDRLYNQKLHYTIFNNQSKEHFLLTDDFQYAPHFSNRQENCSSTPEKVFIASHSFNCLINRENYDILLCDQFETHLEKIDKKVLEKEAIKLQQYSFDAITLFDCGNEEQGNVRKQFTTKEVEIRIRMYGKVELSFSLQALTLRLLEFGKLDCLIQDISIKNEESKDHLLRIPEQTYFLIEGRPLRNGYFMLVKNLFVKCKNVIVNIKRQMPYSLIELIANLTERLGLNLDQAQLSDQDPRRYRQSIKKLNGETKLKNHISQMLLLIRNLYIHEIHLSLTIQLENLSFSNVIILPYFQILNKFERIKNFTDNLTNFYLTTLLAKFPKLSFLMTNFRSPLNTLRLFFNVREALRKKIESEPIIKFGHAQFSSNPFHFSIQRWNMIHSQTTAEMTGWHEQKEKIISYLFQGKRCLVLTNLRLYWLDQEWRNWGLRELYSLKISKNRVSSELTLKFKGEGCLSLLQQHKKCIKMLNNIQKLLL